MSAISESSAVAPATIGNVGPGFDVLGLAISGLTDRVTARRAAHDEVRIIAITGDGGALPSSVASNTAGLAATHTRRLAGREDAGIDLFVEKGIPLESGLGSSAASAAAAAHAVNQILGGPLRRVDLIGPCVEAEAIVSGRHADNVAPALLGGLVLVRSLEPRPVIQRLPVPERLVVVVVTPELRLPTREARSAIPDMVPLAARTRNAANIATFISACYSSDLGLLTDCVEDAVVAQARLPLIRGGSEAIAAARDNGALAASISGAGPSLFALCHSTIVAQSIRSAMIDAFRAAGVGADGIISPADCPGARVARSSEGG